MAEVIEQQQDKVITPEEQERFMRLDAFGQSLAKTRSEAINARQASGIEDIWLEDEEFYEGIDAENRGEQRSNWRTKPPGQATSTPSKTTRSTVFPNITGPFCDAAAARIADMLLPTDDRSWSIGPTPVPELISVSEEKYPRPMMAEALRLNKNDPVLAEKELARATREATQVIARAKEKADKAQTRIEDWHIECQWHAQVRLVIEDSSRIGTGVLKGPVPQLKKAMVWLGAQLATSETPATEGRITFNKKIKPGSKWIDPWNFYPDGACGENIHNGSYTWERDHLTRKQVRELLGQEGYIDQQLQLCLTEGPQHATSEYKETPDKLLDPENKDRFEIWYFHGTAEKDDLEAAGCECGKEIDPHVPTMITMINNRVVRASMNPLDTGDFPYDVMVWRRRAGHWTGSGVARQIRTPQRMIVAGARNLMDNAGLAAGPMLVFRQAVITPADGIAVLAPRKVWYISEDAEEINDANKAIGVIKVDMLVDELLAIINLGMRLAEDVTGLPMLLQGQMGKAPDTVGGMQLLNNNASAVLRRLARLFDDRITEPHVRRYYQWLLQYGEDEEKGDYSIDARGSSALVERDIQNQELTSMGNIVLDPRFGLDPRKWVQEYLKSRHFDPKRFEFDDDKWQKIVEQMSKGPTDPRMAIEQIRAQNKESLAKFEAQTEERLLALEQQFESTQNQLDRELERLMAGFEQQGKKSISFDELKVALAKTALTLRTQRELAYNPPPGAKQVARPAVEPIKRAPRGEAFQK